MGSDEPSHMYTSHWTLSLAGNTPLTESHPDKMCLSVCRKQVMQGFILQFTQDLLLCPVFPLVSLAAVELASRHNVLQKSPR